MSEVQYMAVAPDQQGDIALYIQKNLQANNFSDLKRSVSKRVGFNPFENISTNDVCARRDAGYIIFAVKDSTFQLLTTLPTEESFEVEDEEESAVA